MKGTHNRLKIISFLKAKESIPVNVEGEKAFNWFWKCDIIFYESSNVDCLLENIDVCYNTGNEKTH